jgi:hypothetical protein
MNPKMYFIENLTLSAWALAFWLRLLGRRLRGAGGAQRCYVIDGSRVAMLCAKILAPLAGVKVERLAFRLIDLHDEAGLLIYLRITHQDLEEVQQNAIAGPVFQDLIRSGALCDRAAMFLAKSMVTGGVGTRSSMRKAMFLTHVCLWKAKQEPTGIPAPVLILERRPWLGAILRYASKYGVEITPVHPSSDFRAALRRRIPKNIVYLLRRLRLHLARGGTFSFRRSGPSKRTGDPAVRAVEPRFQSIQTTETPGGRVAVQFHGQLNLNHPEQHSDLPFWQRSPLRGDDVLVIFEHTRVPADHQKWAELAEHGMAAVALNSGATTISAVPVFSHTTGINRRRQKSLLRLDSSAEAAWVHDRLAEYNRLREYWSHLIGAYDIKVYLTWYKYDGQHMAIADALQASGGVTAVYQRSFEPLASPEGTTCADIAFGFSQSTAQVERDSNSVIRYHVTTGYIGDHRYSLLRAGAQRLRDKFQQRGARQILAFSDENSLDDLRWHPGHPFVRENYAFLLEKVLAEPWFGLVLKPKTPQTLRRRLGPVAETLRRAEETGRCYVYEDGTLQGSYPPAAAGLAADIAVHGHLSGGTAAVDQALAGVRTLLMDREGWSVSPLYRLGVGRVVFTDWEELWKACLEHWSSRQGIPGFGDWTPMLEELDPFRDGRAAERMGTYLHWLLEGFRAGHDRETVMEAAAERYCKAWGWDKVSDVCGKSLQVDYPVSAKTKLVARS